MDLWSSVKALILGWFDPSSRPSIVKLLVTANFIGVCRFFARKTLIDNSSLEMNKYLKNKQIKTHVSYYYFQQK